MNVEEVLNKGMERLQSLATELEEKMAGKYEIVDVHPAPRPELERKPRPLYDAVPDSQKMNLALDFVFSVERERQLIAEREALRAKYERLIVEIDGEFQAEREKQKRLLSGIRYSIIEEDPGKRERAGAPTTNIPGK
jgi:hypothetical protein